MPHKFNEARRHKFEKKQYRVSRDKQGENRATIRMRTRRWYLSSRATPCLRDTAPAFCLNLAGLTVVTGSAIE